MGQLLTLSRLEARFSPSEREEWTSLSSSRKWCLTALRSTSPRQIRQSSGQPVRSFSGMPIPMPLGALAKTSFVTVSASRVGSVSKIFWRSIEALRSASVSFCPGTTVLGSRRFAPRGGRYFKPSIRIQRGRGSKRGMVWGSRLLLSDRMHRGYDRAENVQLRASTYCAVACRPGHRRSRRGRDLSPSIAPRYKGFAQSTERPRGLALVNRRAACVAEDFPDRVRSPEVLPQFFPCAGDSFPHTNPHS